MAPSMPKIPKRRFLKPPTASSKDTWTICSRFAEESSQAVESKIGFPTTVRCF